MSDFLLELSKNPNLRKVVASLGLPLPMPQVLRRGRGGWIERPLQDEDVIVGGAESGPMAEAVAETLIHAGANPLLVGDRILPVYADLGEAYGRPARLVPSQGPDLRARALVYDATNIADLAGLRRLYDFFHPRMRGLDRCGRVVVLGRPVEGADTPEGAAIRAALHGFVRSVAKEIGRKGATAQLVVVDAGAEGRVEPLLRFLLSARSAFVSGQPLHVTTAVKSAGEFVWTRCLEGKVALVTGAAQGIGAATALRLAEEGAHVVVLDRPAAESLARRTAQTVDGSVVLADMADPTTPSRITAHLLEAHGGVDVVVHNAGVTRDRTLGRMDEAAWDQALTINLASVAATTDSLVRGKALRDGGRVVCLSSIAGIAGNVGQTNYAASKAGILGLVRHLGGSLAGRGIAVNAVAPGFIETRMTAAVPLFIREAGRRLSALGQGGLPMDVAEVITFLCSPGAAALSGSSVRVCGGSFIGA
jgi:3-oxoacyl-[acyl-carrier protein] reductase